MDSFLKLFKINSVKKVSEIDHSKSPLKEIVKNLFDAKLASLSSILTRSSSAICHLVCSQCSMLSVYLKCVHVYEWYSEIKSGRDVVEDLTRSG